MSFYDTLGVRPEADLDEITAAYRRLAADCHPAVDDSPEAEIRFHELTAAFRVLSDPGKRRDYDTFLFAGGTEVGAIPAGVPSSSDSSEPTFAEEFSELVPPAPPRPVPARAKRMATRRRRKTVAGWSAAALVVLAATAWVVTRAADEGADARDVSPSLAGGRSDLVVFAVGGEHPVSAIVGTGGDRPPVVAWVPGNLLTPQGSGGGSVAQAFAESGATGRTVLSNLTGEWIRDYARLEPGQLAAVVTQRGGIEIDLPSAMRLGRKAVGPGPTRLTGPQVVAYLADVSGDEQGLRWAEVLTALFSGSITLPDDVESSDLAAVTGALSEAEGAEVAELPTLVADGPYRRVDPASMRQGMTDLFGIQESNRVEVILFLGIDRPGLGEAATEALVPRGFHVAGYQETRGLEKGRIHQQTAISYYGDELRDDAERVAQALGVGKVVLTKLGSGVANISVTLGKDYAVSLDED